LLKTDVEHFVQFLINNGVPIDDLKCLDPLNHLKVFTANRLSDKHTRTGPGILKTEKNCVCHTKCLKISKLFVISSHNADVGRNVLIGAKAMDKGEEHIECYVAQRAFIPTV
jgi:hypothetical protein